MHRYHFNYRFRPYFFIYMNINCIRYTTLIHRYYIEKYIEFEGQKYIILFITVI